MRILPYVISLALVSFSLAQEGPQGEAKPNRPTIERDGDRLVFQPEKDTSMEFSLGDFRLAEVRAGGGSIKSWWGEEPGYQLAGEATLARAVNWTIDGRDIVFDIKLGDKTAPQAATERVSVARLNGVLGYTRRVHVAAPVNRREPTDLESRILEFSTHELGTRPKVKEHLNHYGYSTVSSPGVTYTVHSYERKDGQRVWIFRSGLHLMNQAVNPGRDPALMEAVFVEPKGTSVIDLDALLTAYVEVPQDRRALLPKKDPKRSPGQKGGKNRAGGK